MIVGIGTDLTSLPRIRSSVNRFGDKFLARILTERELAAMPGAGSSAFAHIPYIAGRFAAKEAAVKALGTGFSQGIGFMDLEILPEESGKPRLILHGAALARAGEIGAVHLHLSITHEREMAAAFVILEA